MPIPRFSLVQFISLQPLPPHAPMTKQLSALLAALCITCPPVHAACHLDEAAIGTVKATVIGIEVQSRTAVVSTLSVATEENRLQ